MQNSDHKKIKDCEACEIARSVMQTCIADMETC